MASPSVVRPPSRDRSPVAGAFSTLCGLWAPSGGLTPSSGRVLGVTRAACFVELSTEPDSSVVPVLRPEAIRLPTGIRIRADLPWPADVGDSVSCDRSGIVLGSWLITPARAWRPRPVAPAPPARADLALGRLEAAWPTSPRPAPGPNGPVTGHATWERLHRPARLLAGGVGTDATGACNLVGQLVGFGRGLTPSGDDTLCGVLLTLRLLRHSDRLDRLWPHIESRLRTTTTLSASLLAAAAHGHAAPQVVGLLAALGSADDVQAGDLAARVDRVLAIGHSSGADLLAGVHATLTALAPPSAVATPSDPRYDTMKEAG